MYYPSSYEARKEAEQQYLQEQWNRFVKQRADDQIEYIRSVINDDERIAQILRNILETKISDSFLEEYDKNAL